MQQGADTNSNEQRLPLKKRHYHLTSASNQQLLPSWTSDSTQSIVKSINADKPINKEVNSHLKKEAVEKIKCADSQKIQRNSIDEAIEATITRYTTKSCNVSPETNSDSNSTQSQFNNQQCVITTPKKRHRVPDLVAKTVFQSNICKNNNDVKSILKNSDINVKTMLSLRHGAGNYTKVEPSCVQNLIKTSNFIKETNNKLFLPIESKKKTGIKNISKDIKGDKYVTGSTKGDTEKSDNDEIFTRNNDKIKKYGLKNSEHSEHLHFSKTSEERLKKYENIKNVLFEKTLPKTSQKQHYTRSSSKTDITPSDQTQSNNSKDVHLCKFNGSKESNENDHDDDKMSEKLPEIEIFDSSLDTKYDGNTRLSPTVNLQNENDKNSSNLKKYRHGRILQSVEEKRKEKSHKKLFTQKKGIRKSNYFKKPRCLKSCKEVRVNVKESTPKDILITKGVVEKKKVKRRKAINRTGFPSNKKKKKKMSIKLDEIEDKTASEMAKFSNPDCSATKLQECETDKFSEDSNNKKNNLNLSTNTTDLNKSLDCPTNESVKTDDDENNLENNRGNQISLEETTVQDSITEERDSKIEGKASESSGTKRVRKNSSSLSDLVAKKVKTIKTENEEPKVKNNADLHKGIETTTGTISTRKRKSLNTTKNINFGLNRYQYPLLSMKKFKRAKEELRAQRYVTDAKS